MVNRFDNLSLEEMLDREAEARTAADELRLAIFKRLLAGCPVKIGYVYRFNDQVLPRRIGKEFLVCGLRAENFSLSVAGYAPKYAVGVHGFNALKNSSAGDGFGIKPHVVRGWEVLDISSGRVGPREELLKYAKIVEKSNG
jgi:hypothetical protein